MAKESKRILLVEDETDLRNLYQMLLENEGYAITTCADGREGLDEIKKGGYDLVLLDIMLPFIDGLEILEAAATDKDKKQPTSTIILLTNLAQDQTVAKAIELGARGYMVKSDYNPDDLIKAVADFLAMKK